MTIDQIFAELWPCWLLGTLMVITLFFSSHRDLLKTDLRRIGKFVLCMVAVNAIRYIMFKYVASQEMIQNIKDMVHFIPWQATLATFWEDAVHVIPLVILERLFFEKTWYKYVKMPLLLLVMIAFGSGHLYQGVLAAIGLSFYIPLSMNMGKKYGFGTVMLCHMGYDLSTLLFFGWMLGG